MIVCAETRFESNPYCGQLLHIPLNNSAPACNTGEGRLSAGHAALQWICRTVFVLDMQLIHLVPNHFQSLPRLRQSTNPLGSGVQDARLM